MHQDATIIPVLIWQMSFAEFICKWKHCQNIYSALEIQNISFIPSEYFPMWQLFRHQRKTWIAGKVNGQISLRLKEKPCFTSLCKVWMSLGSDIPLGKDSIITSLESIKMQRIIYFALVRPQDNKCYDSKDVFGLVNALDGLVGFKSSLGIRMK